MNRTDRDELPEQNGPNVPIGTLYLVGTPIGNLDDMTFRAVQVLKEADYLYCEDTRRTQILLRHFSIERPQGGPRSFHDHSPRAVVEEIRKLLLAARSIAYVTDGGLPVVSDPGYVLVRAAREAGARVVVVPGPSAAVMLFAASGLPSPKFLFHGFFPRTRGEVERTIETVKQVPVVHVFYEAPGRVQGSLEILNRNVPEALCVMGRELTKIHEETLRGTVAEVFSQVAARDKVRGECAIAVLATPDAARKARGLSDLTQPGSQSDAAAGAEEQPPELTPEQREEITTLVKSGVSSKDAAKELSKKFGVSRRIIYEFIIHHLT